MLISLNALDNLSVGVLTPCFLQNRIPHKKTGKNLYELYELWRDYQSNLK